MVDHPLRDLLNEANIPKNLQKMREEAAADSLLDKKRGPRCAFLKSLVSKYKGSECRDRSTGMSCFRNMFHTRFKEDMVFPATDAGSTELLEWIEKINQVVRHNSIAENRNYGRKWTELQNTVSEFTLPNAKSTKLEAVESALRIITWKSLRSNDLEKKYQDTLQEKALYHQLDHQFVQPEATLRALAARYERDVIAAYEAGRWNKEISVKCLFLLEMSTGARKIELLDPIFKFEAMQDYMARAGFDETMDRGYIGAKGAYAEPIEFEKDEYAAFIKERGLENLVLQGGIAKASAQKHNAYLGNKEIRQGLRGEGHDLEVEDSDEEDDLDEEVDQADAKRKRKPTAKKRQLEEEEDEEDEEETVKSGYVANTPLRKLTYAITARNAVKYIGWLREANGLSMKTRENGPRARVNIGAVIDNRVMQKVLKRDLPDIWRHSQKWNIRIGSHFFRKCWVRLMAPVVADSYRRVTNTSINESRVAMRLLGHSSSLHTQLSYQNVQITEEFTVQQLRTDRDQLLKRLLQTQDAFAAQLKEMSTKLEMLDRRTNDELDDEVVPVSTQAKRKAEKLEERKEQRGKDWPPESEYADGDLEQTRQMKDRLYIWAKRAGVQLPIVKYTRNQMGGENPPTYLGNVQAEKNLKINKRKWRAFVASVEGPVLLSSEYTPKQSVLDFMAGHKPMTIEQEIEDMGQAKEDDPRKSKRQKMAEQVGPVSVAATMKGKSASAISVFKTREAARGRTIQSGGLVESCKGKDEEVTIREAPKVVRVRCVTDQEALDRIPQKDKIK